MPTARPPRLALLAALLAGRGASALRLEAALRAQEGSADAAVATAAAAAAAASLCEVTGYLFDVPGTGSDPEQKGQLDLPSHVVVEMPKPAKAGLRAVIQNNSAATFRRPRITFVSIRPGRGVETSPHGVPTLRGAFRTVMASFPEADTYTYVNSDIAVDASFVATADAVARAVRQGQLRKRFLVVGKRTNVDWNADEKVSDTLFGEEFSQGRLFGGNAEDYFMVSRASFSWASVPPFIVGHRGYDNWLVDHASKDSGVDVIDATQTLRAMHMTDPSVGNKEGFRKSADGRDYNMNLMRNTLRWGCITTDSTQYVSRLSSAGEVQFARRENFNCD